MIQGLYLLHCNISPFFPYLTACLKIINSYLKLVNIHLKVLNTRRLFLLLFLNS